MSNEFVTVLTSWSVEDAHLARIRLIAEGIDAQLADEQTVGMDWSLANAINGVKLFVPEADADRARLILGSESISDNFEAPNTTDSGFSGVENQLNASNEDVDEDDLSPGTLTAFRSLKKPVIWLMLAPTAIGVLILVSAGLFQFLHWLKWL